MLERSLTLSGRIFENSLKWRYLNCRGHSLRPTDLRPSLSRLTPLLLFKMASESFGFQAEISQLLDLIISAYTCFYSLRGSTLRGLNRHLLLEQGDLPSRDYLKRVRCPRQDSLPILDGSLGPRHLQGSRHPYYPRQGEQDSLSSRYRHWHDQGGYGQ